jgi:DNA mismatch repair ATPase MutS
LAKHVINVLGIPAAVVRGDREIALLREDRATQQQQQQEMERMQQMAASAGQAAPAMDSLNEMAGSPEDMAPDELAQLELIEGGAV